MKTSVLFLIFSFFFSFNLFAYQVKPMVSHLQLSKGETSISYRVSNPADVAVPIEVEVFKISFDQDNKEVLTPVEDDFLVLPPQSEVPAKSHQVFRAQLINNVDSGETISYRIIFKQLAIDDKVTESKINMLYNFSTLAFVSPPSAKPILSTKLICQTTCFLEITNTGNGILPLKSSQLKLNDIEFSWVNISGLINKTYLMPGHKYQLPLDKIQGAPEVITRAEFIPNYER